MPYIRQEKHNPNLYTKKRAAEYIGCSVGKINYRVSVGDIPDGEMFVGAKRYYTKKSLDKIKNQLDGFTKEGK